MRISLKFVSSHFDIVLKRYERQMDVKAMVVFCCWYKEKKAHKSVLVLVQNVSGFRSSFECYGRQMNVEMEMVAVVVF